MQLHDLASALLPTALDLDDVSGLLVRMQHAHLDVDVGKAHPSTSVHSMPLGVMPGAVGRTHLTKKIPLLSSGHERTILFGALGRTASRRSVSSGSAPIVRDRGITTVAAGRTVRDARICNASPSSVQSTIAWRSSFSSSSIVSSMRHVLVLSSRLRSICSSVKSQPPRSKDIPSVFAG